MDIIRFPSNHKRVWVCICLAMLLTILCFGVVPAFADGNTKGIWKYFGYRETLGECLKEILHGEKLFGTLNECFNGNLAERINEFTLVNVILNLTKIVGLALTLLHVGGNMPKVANEGRMTSDTLCRSILSFVVPVAIILNIENLGNGIAAFGNFIKDMLLSSYSGSETPVGTFGPGGVHGPEADRVDEIINRVANINLAGWIAETNLGAAASWLIEYIVTMIFVIMDIIMRFGIIIACIGVMGRLLLIRIFLPIGVIDIGDDGWNSGGAKILRQYLATWVEIGAYYLIVYVGWSI